MYVASELDQSWLLSEQRKLYARSWENPDYIFRKLWGLVTDARNLRVALMRVAQNKGRRTAGVDGLTVSRLLSRQGEEAFIAETRELLRAGHYMPSPARRVLIPKAGQPGKFRPLGIPTVRDRVVQAALKNIMEPIFEADFYPASHGFRPGKCAHGALEQLRKLLRPREAGPEKLRRLPYQWAIEGDIKGCFDNISHHGLMNRIRRRISDLKLNRLIAAFLKAGVMSEGQFLRTDAGTPQGGILSPLLANIALSVIEERYERHAWPRQKPTMLNDQLAIIKRANRMRNTDRRRGMVIFMPVRYADDFIILVSAPPGPEQQRLVEEAARQEVKAIEAFLREELNLELSESKTLITPVIEPLRFLGHHVRVRKHPTNGKIVSTAVIPKDRSHRLRGRIKDIFNRKTTQHSLEECLKRLNPILRGWCNYYRHAWGAKNVFSGIDHYVWWTILGWIRKKHPNANMKKLKEHYGWTKPGRNGLRWKDGNTTVFNCSLTPVCYFKDGWLRSPDFTIANGEPGA